jgi:succinate dehydrogenase / fumarate reductase, membrane anchor subunit
MNVSNVLQKVAKSKGNDALQGWLAQRITATLMAVFTLVVLLQVIFNKGPMGYDKWAGIFVSQPMKLLTFVVILAMAWHVVLGMKEIYMDYIKPTALRLALRVFSVIWVVACAGWAIQVLWRV